MIALYNVLLVLSFPLWGAWMLIRARRRSTPVDWNQRAGAYNLKLPKGQRRVWIHAVSVGEFVAAKPLLKSLRRLEPDLQIVVSVSTSSGYSTAKPHEGALFDHVVYFPIDVPRFCLRALVAVRPMVFAVMETELWPNFLWLSKELGTVNLVVNGRISERSIRRSWLVRPIYRAVFRTVARVLAQTEVDASRFRMLGATDVEVFGNTKFDEALDGVKADPVHWRERLGLPSTPLTVVIGSTRSELEESLVAEALADPRLTGISIVWAPRHLERAPSVLTRLRAHRPDARLRSEGGEGASVVLDTYGELSHVYAVADVVVIGGGFDTLGGQNLVQPLAHGKPVLHGPNMANFREVAEQAARAGATVVVADSANLAEALVRLLGDVGERKRMGAAARQLVDSHAGASERYAQAILAAMP